MMRGLFLVLTTVFFFQVLGAEHSSGYPLHSLSIRSILNKKKNALEGPCPARVRTVSDLIEKYWAAATQDENEQAEALEYFTNMQDQLHGELLGQKPSKACYEAVASVYALGSIAGLDRREDHLLADILALLLKQGKVSFLTDKSREEELGGIWSRKQNSSKSLSKGKYSVLGGYKCETSTILIDTSLPPMNLGAIIGHELHHLFRDKFLSRPRALGNHAWVLHDETFASLFGGFLQKRMDSAEGLLGQGSFITQADQKGLKKNRIGAMTLQFDNNLYSPSGTLHRTYERQKPDNRQWEGGGIDRSNFMNYILHNKFLFIDPKNEKIHFTKDVKTVFDIVSKNYFRKPMSKTLQEEFLNWTAGIVFRNEPVGDGPMSFATQASFPFYDPLTVWKFASSYIRIQGSTPKRPPFFDTREVFDELAKILDSESAACTDYRTAIKNHLLDDFLGYYGGDGIKPGGDGIKPCLVPDEKF